MLSVSIDSSQLFTAMLIHNFGLFWRADDVFWGKPGTAGSLLGVLNKEKNFGQVDFREQAGIYVLYADYSIVYVGQTGGYNQKLLSRLKQHLKDNLAGRWSMFSWFGTRSVLETAELKAERNGAHTTHKEVLNHIEAILIHASEPPLNRQGGRWGVSVEQYLQYRDVRLGPSPDEMLWEIWASKQYDKTT